LIGLAFVDEPAVQGKRNSTSTDKETRTKITPKLNKSLFDVETLSPIVTVTNGAWPKPVTVNDISVRIVSLFDEARNPNQAPFLSYSFVKSLRKLSFVNLHHKKVQTWTEAEPDFLQLLIEYYKRGWNPASLHY
jgi:hypothetical protein